MYWWNGGREVAVLVNEKRDAGMHEIRFDGSGLSSGVYVCRLHAADAVQSKKLVYLKQRALPPFARILSF
jgi:hypothetical protein